MLETLQPGGGPHRGKGSLLPGGVGEVWRKLGSSEPGLGQRGGGMGVWTRSRGEAFRADHACTVRSGETCLCVLNFRAQLTAGDVSYVTCF